MKVTSTVKPPEPKGFIEPMKVGDLVQSGASNNVYLVLNTTGLGHSTFRGVLMYTELDMTIGSVSDALVKSHMRPFVGELTIKVQP